MSLVEQETARCFDAAGIDLVSVDEDRARRADHIKRLPVPGRPRTGGSSYQSLERGQGTIEADYLNGEICLLGRLHGVPTPANAVIQRLANRAAAERWKPGRMTSTELLEAVADEADF
jgi:2-dehydropantoate 2-reductase